MPTPWHIGAEQARLDKCLPEGVTLRWILAKQSYQLTYLPPGENKRKALRTFTRSEILGWRNPLTTLNYAARHDLKEAGCPVWVRTVNMPPVDQ